GGHERRPRRGDRSRWRHPQPRLTRLGDAGPDTRFRRQRGITHGDTHIAAVRPLGRTPIPRDPAPPPRCNLLPPGRQCHRHVVSPLFATFWVALVDGLVLIRCGPPTAFPGPPIRGRCTGLVHCLRPARRPGFPPRPARAALPSLWCVAL